MFLCGLTNRGSDECQGFLSGSGSRPPTTLLLPIYFPIPFSHIISHVLIILDLLAVKSLLQNTHVCVSPKQT